VDSGGAGGGGAGLGGAIFNDGGTVSITDSTLAGNLAQGGSGGGGGNNGSGLGGAVFSRNGTLSILDSTLSGNTAAQGGRAVYLLGDGAAATGTLDNSLLGQGDTTVSDLVANTFNGGTATTGGSNNLIGAQVGFAGAFQSFNPPPLAGVFSDPSFETPVLSPHHFLFPSGFGSDTFGSPWTFTGTSALVSNGSPEGNPPAPDGSQAADLFGRGSISQVVNLGAGAYVISLSADQGLEPYFTQTIQVLVDGAVVGTITPSGSAFATYSTNPFTVTAGPHTVRFAGLVTSGETFLDQISIANAVLGPLQNNGGPTQTMALLPGSPAIDAGDNALVPAGLTTDQVGAPRITNGTVDIGAYERQATPTVTWSNPADIVYGTPLSGTQLDATADVPGTFTYTPAAGTVLGVGSHTLSVLFIPTDLAHYSSVTQTATINVLKATPAITWANPPDLVIDPAAGVAAMDGTQLDATADVPGSFVYSPVDPQFDQFPIFLSPGSYTLSVTFTPDDTADYNTATTSVTLNVDPATPAVTWADPADIVYGTPLSSTQLDATADVSGTFTYTPAAGTVLGAGTQTLSVTFTPDDTSDYSSVTLTATLDVLKATPAVTWANPADITYGTPLSAAQLDASANVPGTFAYSPDQGAVLGAGSHTLSVTFTPTDTADYNNATQTATLDVLKATPTVTWSDPAAIVYGTPLSNTQLDATADAPGTFVYSPTAGAVLSPGAHTLSVTFTPTDTADYNSNRVTLTVTLNVLAPAPAITWADPAPGVTAVAYTVIVQPSPVLEDIKLVWSDPAVQPHFALVLWGDGRFNVYDLGDSGGVSHFRHRFSRHTKIKNVVVHVYLFNSRFCLGADLGGATASYQSLG
jgi:hypothetical protein